MAIGVHRVQLQKRESAALGGAAADDVDYPKPISAQEDAIESAGVYFQDALNRDQNVYVERAGVDMRFVDQAVPGGRVLVELIRYYEFLLENDPTAETGAVDSTYTPTYSGITVTKEEWKRNDATLIKSIDYTYTGVFIDSEVRKVFALDGTTIVAQLTWTYLRSGPFITGGVMVRNV
jgi:hypothetical protein